MRDNALERFACFIERLECCRVTLFKRSKFPAKLQCKLNVVVICLGHRQNIGRSVLRANNRILKSGTELHVGKQNQS